VGGGRGTSGPSALPPQIPPPISIIGGGLAGTEAAWQAARQGVRVRLYEMKPQKFSPAHNSPLLGELVCSNSLRSEALESAVGLLKEEMRRLGSLIMAAAEATRVPAGKSLAVDRELFAAIPHPGPGAGTPGGDHPGGGGRFSSGTDYHSGHRPPDLRAPGKALGTSPARTTCIFTTPSPPSWRPTPSI
jgi:choline dehydrogenase-like flavoprotein